MLMPEAGFIRGFQNARIYYRFWEEEHPKAAVILLHGAGEHSEKYLPFAEHFHKAGCRVCLYDMRGHGRSSGIRCHVNDFNEYVLDLDAVLRFVNDRHRAHARTFIASHSMGGLISVYYALQFPYRIAGVIASSPCLGLSLKIKPIKAWAGIMFAKLFSRLALATDIKVECATHDKKVIEWVAKDPLTVHKVTTGFYHALLRAMNYVKRHAGELRVPLLMLQAGKDMICDPRATERFFKDAGSPDKTHKVYAELYHELLNEVGKEDIYRHIEEWIEKRC